MFSSGLAVTAQKATKAPQSRAADPSAGSGQCRQDYHPEGAGLREGRHRPHCTNTGMKVVRMGGAQTVRVGGGWWVVGGGWWVVARLLGWVVGGGQAVRVGGG